MEMRPQRRVEVADSWIGELPLTCGQVRRLGLDVVGDDGDPARLPAGEIDRLGTEHGWSAPTEDEWEVACRGGTGSLFVWGDDLVDRSELDAWMRYPVDRSKRNRWGFGGLFVGEWTSDRFFPETSDSRDDRSEAFVIKGGGAQFWPWQTDTEWIWCSPAMRMPSTDLFADRRAAVRIAVPGG